MKICMPTEGPGGLKEKVYGHFGSAPFFTVYDTETRSIRAIPNHNEHHSHGTCQPLSAIVDPDIGAVLTNGMGKRAVEMLNESGIRVCLLKGNTVEEAIRMFESGDITEMTPEGACGGHGCH